MDKKANIIVLVLLIGIAITFFYKFVIFGLIPFPGDLLIAEYNPWKAYSYLGYNPGSYPNKAQYFDVIRQLYPWKTAVLSSIKSGEFPLWNPYSFSGSPLFANFQSAVLYPLQIVFLFFSQKLAWGILVFLQPLLASIFMYFYARKLSISRLGSVLASVSYAYSQYMIVWLEYNTIGHILAWFPLALLSVEHMVSKKTIMWMGIFVFSLVSIFFAGHIQLALYSCAFIAGYIWLRGNYGIYFLFLFALGIASIQLIPGFELVYGSARSNHEYSFITQKILIQPQQWIMLLIPDFFGNPATRNYFLSDTYIGKVTSIGLIPLLFVGLFLLSKKNTIQKFFLVSAIVIAILISLNPITMMLYSFSIPLISSSSPTLLVFIFSFCLSILAGFGFDEWIRISRNRILVIVVSFLVLFGLLWVTSDLASHKAILLQALILVTGATLIVSGNLYKKYSFYIACLLLGILLLDLFRAFHKFNPFIPQSLVYPTAPVITFLQNQKDHSRVWGYHAGAMEANFATQVNLLSTDGYDPLYARRYGEFLGASKDGVLLHKFSTTTRSDAVISQEKSLPENPFRLKILDVLGVKYILDAKQNRSSQIDFPPYRFQRVYEDDYWNIYKNLQSLPYAFLTADYGVFTSGKEFETKFFDRNAPIDRVLLEEELGSKLANDPVAVIKTVQLDFNRISLITSAKTNQLLFISNSFSSGWQAIIDNEISPILRANYAFQALEVPSGKHSIKLTYRPWSFVVGAYVSILSLLCFILYLGIQRRKSI